MDVSAFIRGAQRANRTLACKHTEKGLIEKCDAVSGTLEMRLIFTQHTDSRPKLIFTNRI